MKENKNITVPVGKTGHVGLGAGRVSTHLFSLQKPNSTTFKVVK